jgi:hypothetical protein
MPYRMPPDPPRRRYHKPIKANRRDYERFPDTR